MADDLPTEFDLIVIGTGLTESIVAAAGSRIGKIVLHIDPNDFYGGHWTSFNLDNFQQFIDASSKSTETESTGNDVENGILKLNNKFACQLQNAEYEWFANNEPVIEVVEEKLNDDQVTTEEISSDSKNNLDENLDDPKPIIVEEVAKDETKTNETWTKERILKESRKFNIDLVPKLLFARGDLVELLISSNICRYAEFRAVDKVTTRINGDIKAVPCSRSDVFTTKDVNVVEKRLLMKILSNCMNYEAGNAEFKDFETKTFRAYLESKGLTVAITHYILYAIGMSDDVTPCIEGILRTKKFLGSLGRYGNTPFLFPMYGCGEIPQCFCRLCAVFGGVYCLKRPIAEIHFGIETNASREFVAIKCGDQIITGKEMVCGSAFNLPEAIFLDCEKEENTKNNCGRLSRAIYITDKPLGSDAINSGGGGVNYLKLPSISKDEEDGALVIQLAHFSGTCPKGLYLIHVVTKAKINPKSDIEPYKEQLFNDETSAAGILWSAHFSIPSCIKCLNGQKNLPKNFHISCGPFFELDYDRSIKEAKDIFQRIYSEEEFLPRAPDPEQIIIEGTPSSNDVENTDFNSSISENDIKEKIEEVVEGIENEAKCIQENAENENK